MHCESCVSRISEALSKLPGVQDLEVSLQPQQAAIHSEGRLDRETVRKAIQHVGKYEVLDAVESNGHAPGSQPSMDTLPPANAATYYPLLLVLGFLLLATGLLQWRAGVWNVARAMSDFMGCFFVVFAFFKLLDLEGFAGTFSRYDLLAARSTVYARVYPFLELSLGVAYLALSGPQLVWVNVATLVLMTIGSLGVIDTLCRREQIQCACLGTVIQLPMSTVTLIEDAGMALMAAVMLVM